MSEEVKFTEEELKKLKDIQQGYVNIQVQLGQVGIARIKLEQQLNDVDNSEIDLRKRFQDNTESESKFLDEIRNKYGDGQLDPETGIFTKNN